MECMTAWIIYFKEAAEYNGKYIQFYKEEGAKLGIEIRLILVEKLEFGVRDNSRFIKYLGQETEKPDFVICRAIYPLLSKQLELMGIKVFNNSFVSEICNDKARTYQYLANAGIRMVDTSFYRNNLAMNAISNLSEPSVLKAVDGHGGSQVFLLKPSDMEETKIMGKSVKQITEKEQQKIDEVLEGLKGSDAVLQPLVGSKHQDLRVYVIGNEIVAAVLRTAREGFKSNYSLGGSVQLYLLSQEEKALVDNIISRFDFGLVGIDFIIGDDGELIFNEIEDVVGARMLYQCSDINIVERYLRYIKEKISFS